MDTCCLISLTWIHFNKKAMQEGGLLTSWRLKDVQIHWLKPGNGMLNLLNPLKKQNNRDTRF